ncbi:putative eka-like protein [Erysiphe necator]|uniref:Putative eka-like protein n=1 Tax=Uncinula necator TaxID=52586 RepID=A0A0B1P1T0_UNCNE|nr:putative eka-like protein [Erysiphe necator]
MQHLQNLMSACFSELTKTTSGVFLLYLVCVKYCIPSDVTHVTRTPTSFVLTIKEKEIRQKLLNDCDRISSQGTKLEPVSDLITYRIATVPIALRTSSGSVTVDDTNLVAEIIRVTYVAPKIVRVHSKIRSGAPHCSWLARFSREQAPRPGF